MVFVLFISLYIYYRVKTTSWNRGELSTSKIVTVNARKHFDRRQFPPGEQELGT